MRRKCNDPNPLRRTAHRLVVDGNETPSHNAFLYLIDYMMLPITLERRFDV